MYSGRINELIASFNYLDNVEDKYIYLMNLGQKNEFPNKYKKKEYEISGCQSTVWVVCSKVSTDNSPSILLSSNSLIIKGIVSLFMELIKGMSHKEVLNFPFDEILHKMTIIDNLTMNRRNGINAIIKAMKSCAKNNL